MEKDVILVKLNQSLVNFFSLFCQHSEMRAILAINISSVQPHLLLSSLKTSGCQRRAVFFPSAGLKHFHVGKAFFKQTGQDLSFWCWLHLLAAARCRFRSKKVCLMALNVQFRCYQRYDVCCDRWKPVFLKCIINLSLVCVWKTAGKMLKYLICEFNVVRCLPSAFNYTNHLLT